MEYGESKDTDRELQVKQGQVRVEARCAKMVEASLPMLPGLAHCIHALQSREGRQTPLELKFDKADQSISLHLMFSFYNEQHPRLTTWPSRNTWGRTQVLTTVQGTRYFAQDALLHWSLQGPK